MPMFSNDFGAMIRGLLEARGWSNRQAAARTRGALSHTLIREMRVNGYVPDAERIVELARALGEDPNRLLDAAGKPAYLRYVGENAARVTVPLAA